MLEGERLVFRSRLADLIAEVETKTADCMTALRTDGAEPSHLATLLASLVFLAKWTAQVAELRLGL